MSSIQRIKFGPLDPDMLRRIGVPIESSATWDQNTVVKGGLMDLHLGTIDRRYVCQTCGQKEKNCAGHIGIIELVKPCFIVNMLDQIIKVLRCVCPDCSALLIAPEDVKECSLDWVADEVAGRASHRFCVHGHPSDYYGCDEGGEGDEIEKKNRGCGAHRADYTKVDGLHIKGVFYEQVFLPEPMDLDVPDDEAPDNGESGGGDGENLERRDSIKKRKRARKPKPKYQSKEQIVTPERAFMILRKISPEHAQIMGFGEKGHPSWMIWTVLPVVPPSERPSIQMSAQRRGEDDLTGALFAVIKENQALEKKISEGVHPSQLSPSYELLQFRVATYTTNDIQKQPKAKQRSGREIQGVIQKLKTKEGLVRGNMMGKRVDFSSRSVITGEPNLSIVEVGVPLEVAMTLTKPVHVTAENMDECWESVMRGPYEYGGANSIIKRFRGIEYVVDLKMARDRSDIKLRKGMIIERHLKDGDWVLFNRQPTLHRMGMMAHRVKVVKSSTFRMNESVTPPYNADFDGDEMNLHAPQSERTTAELKWLCAVDNHLRSPKNSGATIGLVQDALLAGYLLSLNDTLVDREVFFDCIMSMKHGWSRDIPSPIGIDTDGRPTWTGKQLLSMAIPRELNLERGGVHIYNGELVKGTLDKKLLGVGSGSLVHLVVVELGEDRARDFLDNLHDVCISWLKHRGFTFGFRDITIPNDLNRDFKTIIDEAKVKIDAYLENVKDPETGHLTVSASKVEGTINQMLNQVLSRAAKEVLPRLPHSNLYHMAAGSKSKGKESNVTQMVAYVGQQNIYGGRIPCGMIGRTTCHFRRGDLGLRNRGFVEQPYVEGLGPQEVFMHAAGGREGLVDTAIKTAKTGYALRQMTNAMSDISVDTLYVARNSRGCIIQFSYGGDNIDPTKLVSVRLNYGSLSKEKFRDIYRHDAESVFREEDLVLLDEEWNKLQKDRRFVQRLCTLPEAFLCSMDDEIVKLSVDIDRLILDAQVRFQCGPHAESEVHARAQIMHPTAVIEKVKDLVLRIMEVWSFDLRLVSERRYATKMLRIVIRSRLASKRVIGEFQLSQRALEWLCNRVVEDYCFSIVQPGEAVGSLSSQSNGEPQQQMTLNTFHFAGISSQNVTLGVPRIKEVTHCTREPKVVNTLIFLNTPYSTTTGGTSETEEFDNFKEAWLKRGQVLELLVKDAIKEHSVLWDPDMGRTVLPEDQLMEEMHAIVFPDFAHSGNLSGHVIRLVFDPIKLAAHSLNFGAVVTTLRDALGDGDTTACSYSDSDSEQLVFRIRARYSRRPVDRDDDRDAVKRAWMTLEQSTLIRFYQQQVENIRLSGLEDVRNVFIREDERGGGLLLDTDCRDMEQAMAVNDSFADRCECNHPLEVYDTLGVEAARQSIIIEIRKVYRYYGINVDARHLTLVADAMTSAGGMMSLDRHGINHADLNTLKKAAFEEIADVLTKAAITSTVDPLCDNTSRIMIGQEVRIGTGTFDLFLDREEHEKLAKSFMQSNRKNYRDRGIMRRRKQAIDAHMRALESTSQYGGYGGDDGFSGATKVKAMMSGEPSFPMDPMSISEFNGSGFGFGGGQEGYDPANPFGFGADEYDPEHPEMDGPGLHIERRPYSPTAGWESPIHPVQNSTNANRPYSPTSPRYSPTSPRYSPAGPEYDPDNPGYSSFFGGGSAVDAEYDPENPGFGDDDDDNKYDPGW